MVRLAEGMDGYLGVESARDPETKVGITVSYWRDAAAVAKWRAHSEHVAAQRNGRKEWYTGYFTRVATVERAYSWSMPATATTSAAPVASGGSG